MPVCVATSPGAGGAQYLVLDTSQTNLTNCTYVLEDGSSYIWHELGNLSLEQASQIGMMVGLVWAVAYGFKLILRALRVDETPNV